MVKNGLVLVALSVPGSLTDPDPTDLPFTKMSTDALREPPGGVAAREELDTERAD